MKFMLRSFAGLLALLVLSLPPAAAENAWELKKDSKGIQVHTREVTGSPILEYKGRVVVARPLEAVMAYYEDAAAMTEWFHNCTASRLLEDRGPEEQLLYFVIAMPWPVKNRDGVYRRVRTTDAATGTVEYRITAEPESLPPADGLIRMPMLQGLWRLTPQADGRTEMVYQQHSDTGGHIPALVVNQLAVSIPFNTLRNFREKLER